MKSREFHKFIRKNGWAFEQAEGSHYIYVKDGRRYPVPFHGSKEVFEPLRKKIIKDGCVFKCMMDIHFDD